MPDDTTNKIEADLVREQHELTRKLMHEETDRVGANDHVGIEDFCYRRELTLGLAPPSIEQLPVERRVPSLAFAAELLKSNFAVAEYTKDQARFRAAFDAGFRHGGAVVYGHGNVAVVVIPVAAMPQPSVSPVPDTNNHVN